MKKLLIMSLILLSCVACKSEQEVQEQLYILTDNRNSKTNVIDLPESFYGAYNYSTNVMVLENNEFIEDVDGEIAGGYRVTFYKNNKVKLFKYYIHEGSFYADLSYEYDIVSAENGVMKVAEKNFEWEWRYELVDNQLKLRTHLLSEVDEDVCQLFYKVKDL